MNNYINLNINNIDKEHICCAIGDKKHSQGVLNKKEWIKSRLSEGHIFRKLDAQGKVFIEYTPLEFAWAPVEGKNFMFIYCLWVAGSFKGNGYAKELLEYAINDAKQQHKDGICVVSSKKKKPFLSEKSFFEKHNFKVVDSIGDYELLALNFNDAPAPQFTATAKSNAINSQVFTIYYSPQCPYVNNCIKEITDYTKENNIQINLVAIDTLEKAKTMPSIFTNWAVFYKGKFVSNTLLNKNSFVKLLSN